MGRLFFTEAESNGQSEEAAGTEDTGVFIDSSLTSKKDGQLKHSDKPIVIPPQTSQASARGSLEPRDLSPGLSNELSVG